MTSTARCVADAAGEIHLRLNLAGLKMVHDFRRSADRDGDRVGTTR